MARDHDYEDLEGGGGEEEQHDEEEYEDGVEEEEEDRSKRVSFSSRTRRAVLKPEPEIKTLPGTSLYCIAPSEERQQPQGGGDDPYSSFVDLPEETGELGAKTEQLQ